MIADWATQYVGLPFQWNGYDRDGIGCYGLVALVLREQYNIELPRHDDIADLLETTGTADVPLVPGWEQIGLSNARAGDVLHMQGIHHGKIVPMHIGVFVSSIHALHIEQEAGSCIVDVTNRKHSWRVIGAHRHA